MHHDNKKFCIFSAQYLPHMGGVERYTYYLAKELVRDGNSVVIVTSLSPGLKEREETDGIKIYRLPSFNFMDGRMPVLKPGKALRQAENELKAEKFDYVLINTRFYFMSLFGAKFAKKNKIASGVVEHGSGHLTFNNSILDIAEKIYEHGITGILKHYCKDYYGVSKACCKWSGHFGIKSKGVLYNAIDIDEVEELTANPIEDYRKLYGIEAGDVVIAYTGRMIKEKGIYELAYAVEHMKCDGKVVLLMAGDGPEYDGISAISYSVSEKTDGKRRIECLGRIDFPHIAALLKQSDIYCLPSVSEGFPTSVLEAVAAKCFVITTYNGGARELIEDGVSGVILKDNNRELLTKALEKSTTDRESRQKSANLAYEKLKSRFTWKATAHKLMAYAERQMEERHG